MMWFDIVLLVSVFVCLLSLLIIAAVIPLVCWYYIVPGIEKKIGKKLGYSPSDDMWLWDGGIIGQFFKERYTRYISRPDEITGIIMDLYYPNKKKYYLRLSSYMYSESVVKESGYTREMISRGELIFCYFNRIVNLLVGVSAVVAFGVVLLNFDAFSQQLRIIAHPELLLSDVIKFENNRY